MKLKLPLLVGVMATLAALTIAHPSSNLTIRANDVPSCQSPDCGNVETGPWSDSEYLARTKLCLRHALT